jgi:hypothetical protein
MFSPRIVLTQVAAAAVVLACVVERASAQATPQAAAVPAVGQPAPDFSLIGATRYGLLASPVRLSDFRGKTVVLAFFFQARTKG